MLWLLRALGCVGAVGGLTAEPTDAVAAVPPPVEAPACLGAEPCAEPRDLHLDVGDLPLDRGHVVYDLDEVTRRVRLARLAEESELSLAVRLVLAEVGPDRLVHNQHALEEAVGVLATVRNRLDPQVWDPGAHEPRPWPGCGEEGTFATCATPDQYRGLRAWRALHPAAHVDPELLLPAVDRAVTAWWMLHSGAAEDPTGGATSFVHRCGGEAYGAPTTRCDGTGDDDLPGAHPHTGPIVFKGPARFDPSRGLYRLRITGTVDWERASTE